MSRPKPPTKIDIEMLKADLIVARDAAKAAITGQQDGGTSCFDHPVLLVPKDKKTLAAIEAAGFRPSDGYGFWKGFVSLYGAPGSNYQGQLRTTGAETVAKVLSDRGWTANVHYAMD